MKRTLLTAAFASVVCVSAPAALRLNEIHINPPGDESTANAEYIEVISTTGGVESTNGLTILIIDSNGGSVGNINKAISLNGKSTGSNGLLYIGPSFESAPAGGVFSAVVDTNTAFFSGFARGELDPNGGMTVLLVSGYSTPANLDLDSDDNGTLNNSVPWTTIVDSVAYGDHPYGANVGTASVFSPDNISRLGGNLTAKSADAWYGGEILNTTGFSSTGYDPEAFIGDFAGQATPGKANIAPPSNITLLINEVNVNPPGPDGNFEYIELIAYSDGQPAAVGLTGYSLLVIETNAGGNRGMVVENWDLSAFVTGPNGLVLIGDGYDTASTPDTPYDDFVSPDTGLADPAGFGGGDVGGKVDEAENLGFTLLLVRNPTAGAAVNTDLDAGDDGILDSSPWAELIDSVGFSQLDVNQEAIVSQTYAGVDLAQPAPIPSGYHPDNLSRLLGNTTANSFAAWYGGDFGSSEGFGIGYSEKDFFGGFRGTATPGNPNLSAALAPAAPGTVLINEVNIDPPGPDGGSSAEFVELLAPSGLITPLNGLHVLVVSATPGSVGDIREVWSLSPYSTGPNGIFIFGDNYDTISPFEGMRPDSSMDDVDGFEQGDIGPESGMLLVLVSGLSADVGAIGSGKPITSLNSGGGSIDLQPWGALLDSVGYGVGLGAPYGVLPVAAPDNIARRPRDLATNSAVSWTGGELVGTAFSTTYNPETAFGGYVGGGSPAALNHAAQPGIGSILINEVHINPPGPDENFEFVELISSGLTEQSTNGLTLLVFDTTGGDVGTVLDAWELDSFKTGTNGLLLLGDGYDVEPKGGPHEAAVAVGTSFADPKRMGTGDLTDDNSFTMLLVSGFRGAVGVDYDANDDGILDQNPPWQQVVDSVGYKNYDASLMDYDSITYALADLSRIDFEPESVARTAGNFSVNSAGAWYGGQLSGAGGTSYDYDSTDKFNLPTTAAKATPGSHNYIATPLNDQTDVDRDGANGLAEAAFGMDPEVPDAHLLPQSAVATVGPNDYPAIRFAQIPGGTGTVGNGYTVNGISYFVEHSPDMVTWTRGTNITVVSTDLGAGPNGTDIVTIRHNTAIAPGNRLFLRIFLRRN
ncbi:MAG: hypothetical protein R3F11_18915 [Verrucomicrobiales bacterium]